MAGIGLGGVRIDLVDRARIGRLRLLAGPLDLPPAGDVALVTLQRVGEGVAAGAVGDEEQILGPRRVGDRLQSRAAGIGDRAGRQALDHVGVVGGRPLDLRAHDAAPEGAAPADQAVDDGRIGLQLHPLLQPIDEHARDPRTLVGPAGLLLDDGGQRHHLGRRLDRHLGAAALPDLVQHLALLGAHQVEDLLAGGAALELVGVGEKRALGRRLGNLAREDVVVPEPGYDLLRSQALREGDGVLDLTPVGQGLDRVLHARMGLEHVLAMLQRPLAAESGGHLEQARMIDHALTGEDAGNLRRPAAAGNHHDLVGGERPRLGGLAIEQGQADQGAERENDAECEEPADGGEQAAAAALRLLGRGRGDGGLDGLARAARRRPVRKRRLLGSGRRRRRLLSSAKHPESCCGPTRRSVQSLRRRSLDPRAERATPRHDGRSLECLSRNARSWTGRFVRQCKQFCGEMALSAAEPPQPTRVQAQIAKAKVAEAVVRRPGASAARHWCRRSRTSSREPCRRACAWPRAG